MSTQKPVCQLKSTASCCAVGFPRPARNQCMEKMVIFCGKKCQQISLLKKGVPMTGSPCCLVMYWWRQLPHAGVVHNAQRAGTHLHGSVPADSRYHNCSGQLEGRYGLRIQENAQRPWNGWCSHVTSTTCIFAVWVELG